jgi:hypothetical protein
MKSEGTINLNGKDYKLKFTYGSFRWLGRKWQLKGIGYVMQHIDNIAGPDKIDPSGLTFDQEDVIIDLIMSGIDSDEVDQDVLIESGILLDVEQLTNVFNLFTESFAQVGKNPAAPPQNKRGKKVKK